MKYLTLIIILLTITLSVNAQSRKKKAVEVTCPSYSNATIVTYKWKKGTPRTSLKKKNREDYLYFKRRNGHKNHSFVKNQAPKKKRFSNDRKKTQKRLLDVGLEVTTKRIR